jgi:exodeoxyribonuclease V gamma subunit
VRATDEIVDAFSRLLEVVDGRMTATDVLDLLRIAAVRSRFGIEAEDVDLLRSWVGKAGVRWGIDAAHREAVGQPPFHENTWRFGLDRLLLGFAMPGNERDLFGGALPYDDVEGSSAALLGKLAELCTTLFGFRESLAAPRDLDAWREALGKLLAAMVASSDLTADQHNEVRKALARLAARATAGGFRAELPLDAVRPLVLEELTRAPTARGFLSGGVTFCEMVPMRAIPFRVVCLIGMDGDAFPRIRRALGFDLVARRPRRGDRSAREDDRYLFLEALLSARDRLLITHVGQSIRDNAELPPSVVVSELLDALGESFVVPDDGSPAAAPRAGELPSEHAQRRIRERLVVRHPLQPFSTRYFGDDPELFSYAGSYFLGAQALHRPQRPAPPFVAAPLSPPRADDATASLEVDVDDLIRFIERPARAFLQRRLLLTLGQDAEPIVNREPLLLDNLERWGVGDAILAVAPDAPRDAFPVLRARGTMPPGTPGRCTFDEIVPEAAAIARRARAVRAAPRLADVPVALELGRFRLRGLIEDLYPEHGHVRVQFSRLQGRSEIGAWVRHLVLCCLGGASVPRRATIVGRAAKKTTEIQVTFRPAEDPHALLATLLELWEAGQSEPLPLFDRASRRYAEARRRKGGTHDKALEAARREYDGGYNVTGESQDPYVQLAFAGRAPLGSDDDPGAAERFAQLACAVFEPLLAHREARA